VTCRPKINLPSWLAGWLAGWRILRLKAGMCGYRWPVSVASACRNMAAAGGGVYRV